MAARNRRPLWICPRCKRRFANRNQSHACGRHDLAHHFRGKDRSIRRLFDAVRRAVAACGPVTVLPEKTRIAFQVRMSFAQVTPHQRWLDGHVVLARRLPHPRFRRIDTISARNHVHHFRLCSPTEVDAEFRSWLREAYAVGAQEHLAPPSGPAYPGSMKAAPTAEAWLASQPPARARELARVRATIVKRLPPGYEEVAVKNMIVYQVPLARYPDTYNGQPLWLAALAAPKSYLTLHLMPVYGSPELARQLAAGFKSAGKKLNIGKACIRFQRADDLALDVIEQIVEAVPVDRWVAVAEAVRRR